MEGDGELLRLLPLLLQKSAVHVPFGAAPRPPTTAQPSSLLPSYPLNDSKLQRTRIKSAPPSPCPLLCTHAAAAFAGCGGASLLQ